MQKQIRKLPKQFTNFELQTATSNPDSYELTLWVRLWSLITIAFSIARQF